MKIFQILLFISVIFIHAPSYSQDSIFVKTVGRACKILNYEVVGSDTINMNIGINKQNLKIGKWIFYFDSGMKRSEGFFSLELRPQCGVGGPIIPNYYEERTGVWNYWTANGAKRFDLFGDEHPCNGYFNWFHEDGRIFQKGLFGNRGNLITGQIYLYSPVTKELISIDDYSEGKYIASYKQ